MKIIEICSDVVFAVSVGLFAIAPAQAADPAIPADVVQWFAHESSSELTANSDYLDFPADSTLGAVTQVYQWNDGFLANSNPSQSQLTPIQEWTAPVLSADTPVGTIKAYRASDGTVQFASASNDWSDAAMIITMPASGRYVNDVRNAAFIIDGTTVHQATQTAVHQKPHAFTTSDVYTTTTATLRDAIKEQRSADAAATAEAGEPVSGGGPIDLAGFVAIHGESQPNMGWPVGTIAAVALSGIAVLLLVGVGFIPSHRRRALS
ncbi:MAG: hypothetical protein FWD75_00475 [Propionibacteriaceae bacterium]|nr:hypothetical protein [Propionibacteriaceae bacterium]